MPPKLSADELLDRLSEVGRTRSRRSSFAEFRANKDRDGAVSRESSWWRYALATPASGDPKHAMSAAEQRALSKASGPVGAFLVPQDLEHLILSVVRARGSVSQVARVITTSTGDTLGVPIASVHPAGAWIAEAGTISPLDDTYAQVNLNAFKGAALCIVSEELSRDALSEFDGYLAGELGARISALESAAFVNGTGSGQPQGFLANFPVATAASGNSTSFDLVTLTNALHSVPPEYRSQGGAWIGSDGILKALRQKVDTAGNPILLNASNPGDPPMLLGYPFLVDENMPTNAASNKSLAFGGWAAAYAIRRVVGIQVTRLVELYSAGGQLGYKAVLRTDGRVLTSAAGIAIAHSAT